VPGIRGAKTVGPQSFGKDSFIPAPTKRGVLQEMMPKCNSLALTVA